MNNIRQSILELEQLVEDELSTESNDVTIGRGYDELNKYLLEKSDLNLSVRNQAYRYWTFLTLLRIVPNPNDFEGESAIHFSPEHNLQSGAGPRLFVEPNLPTYPQGVLYDEANKFTYLKSPTEDETIHHIPNKIVSKNNIDRLPWPADPGIEPPDQNELQELCVNGNYDQVANQIGIDTVPSNYGECLSLIENRPVNVDKSNNYDEWKKFSNKVEYIIDCNQGSLTETDYSKILWYGIAYKQPLIIVTSEQITDTQFQNDLNMLPSEVLMVENFSIDSSPSECLDKLKRVM